MTALREEPQTMLIVTQDVETGNPAPMQPDELVLVQLLLAELVPSGLHPRCQKKAQSSFVGTVL
jgi:hypothetical protein